jgi:peptidoglycan/xylan/chitin deacetylase (PgdA/CDA1 family)
VAPPTHTPRPATATVVPTSVSAETATAAPAGTESAATPTTAALPTAAQYSGTRVPGDLSQVERVPPGKHRIALTFDAGSTVGDVPAILAALSRYDAHVTFFVTGQWAKENPDMVRLIVAAGDEIANHSYTHPSFPKLTDAEMVAEVARCEAQVQEVAGVSTKPYWRPPFGDETGHVLNVVKGEGYRSIYWTWDSLDSVGKPKTKDFIVKRVTEASINLDGAIILQHVAAQPSVDALPEILQKLYAQGLKVVTITELLSP